MGEIRCLKTRNPNELKQIINKEFDNSSYTSEIIVFTKCIDHFRELNAGS